MIKRIHKVLISVGNRCNLHKIDIYQHKYTEIYSNLHKFTETYKDLQKSTYIYMRQAPHYMDRLRSSYESSYVLFSKLYDLSCACAQFYELRVPAQCTGTRKFIKFIKFIFFESGKIRFVLKDQLALRCEPMPWTTVCIATMTVWQAEFVGD